MPIRWTGRITSARQLAGVIQGEAASPAGQFAVASVMWNRMNNAGPYLGGGSGDVSQVVTPTQFNGYDNNPSSYAQSLANDLWNGNAPQGGSTGNATFFAAPDLGNAAWANPNTASGAGLFSSGENIGGNYYSDRQGPPSDSFQPPVYGGDNTSQIASGGAGDVSTTDLGGYAGASNYDPQPYGGLSPIDSAGPSDAFGVNGPNYAAAGGDPNNPVGSPGNPGDVSGMIGQGNESGLQALFGPNVNPQAVNSQATWNMPAPPVEISNISAAGEIAGQTIGKGLNANAKAINTAAQSGIQAGQGWLDTIRQTGTDALVRGGLITLALVILAGAWLFYGKQANVKVELPA